MPTKKAYSGCLELLGHYKKSDDPSKPDEGDLIPDAPGSSSPTLGADPHPTPEPPDDDNGPG